MKVPLLVDCAAAVEAVPVKMESQLADGGEPCSRLQEVLGDKTVARVVEDPVLDI